MAIKALMLKKKIDMRKKSLDELLAKDEEFATRESELAKALEEATTDEEVNAVEEETEKFAEEKKEHDDAKSALESEINDLTNELAEAEKEQETKPAEEPAEAPKAETAERKVNFEMNKRNVFAKMDVQTRTAMFEREDVKSWVGEFRSAIKEKRSLSGIGLTIPTVLLGYLRQNIEDYSKLYRHVRVRPVGGDARTIIEGTIPEAVWTECCANLNELDLEWNDAETGCYKCAGFFKVCNATLEDSDIDLAAELLLAIGQAIGFALDKAILYGRNSADNYKMPLGIVSRLAQTSEPSDYPATARTWVDLHTTNMLTIANTVTGIDLFKTLALDSVVIKGKYARGEKVWVMNETTYTFLKAQAMSVNAAGAIVSGVDGTMPVIGGIVEVLDFIPDYVIIGGYMELYLLAERAGQKFAQSEHVKFLQDQTVFKGTARYDGLPLIAEAFAVIGVNGTTPSASMTFAADNANTVEGIVLNTNAVTLDATETAQIKATALPLGIDASFTYTSSDTTKATVDAKGKITAVATGSAVITVSAGDANAVVNVTVSA